MKTRDWGRIQRLAAFVLLAVTQGYSQLGGYGARSAIFGYAPVLNDPQPTSDWRMQCECADQLVTQLARRDRLNPYVMSQETQLEPSYRIRVFFQFREDMTKVLPKLKRFWKFPRWIGKGRYASSYGHFQPGFELHLDPKDPTRTVGFNAPKSSDVDDHEPAGDLPSIFLHAVNLVQHKLGAREKAPCRLLAELPREQEKPLAAAEE